MGPPDAAKKREIETTGAVKGAEREENLSVNERFPSSPTGRKTDAHCATANELRSDRFFHSSGFATRMRKHEARHLEEGAHRGAIVGVPHKGPGVVRCIVQQPCILMHQKPPGLSREQVPGPLDARR